MRSSRLFDLVIAIALILPASAIMAVVALAIAICDGRPILHVSERMRRPGQAFRLYKFRTMRPAAGDSGVTGGEKASRITPLGRILRDLRIDELPQLFNILKGDMGFVGPRPPLRAYVELYPRIYAQLLRDGPGLTGLATLVYRRHEARLLSACSDASETDAVYRRRCIPAKARLDLIHQRHRSLPFDAGILLKTVIGVVRA